MKSFSAQVEAWTKKSKLRTEAVFRTAIQSVANEANTPQTRGGNLPVDTHFLQNSLSAKIGSVPSGSSVQGEPMGDPGDVSLVLAGAKITDLVFVGWTAEYARYMNIRFAFRDLAVQRWQHHVDRATEEAKRRIP